MSDSEADIARKMTVLRGKGLTPLTVSEWNYNSELRNALTFKSILKRDDALLTVSLHRKDTPRIDMIVLDREASVYLVEIKKSVSKPSEVHDILIQTLAYTAGFLEKRWDYEGLQEEFQGYWRASGFEPKSLNIGVRHVHQAFFRLEEPLQKQRFNAKLKTPRVLLAVETFNVSRIVEAVSKFRRCRSYDEFEAQLLPHATQGWRKEERTAPVRDHWDDLKGVNIFYSVFMPQVLAEALTGPQAIEPLDLGGR